MKEAGLARPPVLTIRLLGNPQVHHGDGPARTPRGNKVWGLLAFLALTGAPQPRHLLAGMLFPEANDPLRALRWNIAELRRLLGDGAAVEGDPVALTLPATGLLDIDVLLNGTWTEGVRLPGLGQELLQGLYFDSAPAFDLWLSSERSRLGAAAAAVLHEATLASLARRSSQEALGYATRLAAFNLYDENSHVLMARALIALGEREQARRHVERTTQMFHEELGVAPSPSFRLAALSDRAASIPNPSPSAVTAQLEAGQAAIGAGAWLNGIETLRGAIAAAEGVGDDLLRAQAHIGLGSALVHAARGFDEEGAMSLHRASELAGRAGDPKLEAQAKRELAYIELLRGRYERVFSLLDAASLLVGERDAEAAWIAAVRGAAESDVARYEAARSWLDTAIARAEATNEQAVGAFAHTFLGRFHLLQMNLDLAWRHLEQSLELARAARWTAFVPFPMSLLAEVVLLSGEVASARERFDHAFALSAQLGDPCWESLGARGLGLVAAEQNDVASAMARLDEAPRLCRRFPDSYLWVEAYALEALCRVAVKNNAPGAPAMITELESIVSRTGMRELLARAMLHRAALGVPEALDVAKSLIASIDNPALKPLLDTATG